MESVAERLRAAGGHPYVIPLGASNGLGALGYVRCAEEIEAQAEALGVRFDTVVVANGAGGTQAGLIAGFDALGSPTRVLGVGVGGTEAEHAQNVRNVLAQLGETVAQDMRGLGSAIWCSGSFGGPPHPQVGAETLEAIEMAARLEGILVDPTYTGKALAGLIALTRDGTFGPGKNVLFLHTGGIPGLYAHAPELLVHWRRNGPDPAARP
jgi:1-aminocyclopropane-1-carboxylate deaminase/D-cysteine desulfhydrase-like pyridoxal-dependent ACC family enzyme